MRRNAGLQIFRYGAVYFAIIFAVGFVLGIVRVLLLIPLLGERWAELAEMPIMGGCILAVAISLFRRRSRGLNTGQWLLVGAIALGLMLVAEFFFVLGLRGLSLSQYFAQRDPVSGTVYGLMLILFALMPWLVTATKNGTRGD